MAQVVVDESQFDFASLPAVGIGYVEYNDFILNASATPYLRFTIGSSLGVGQVEIGATSSTASGIIATLAQIPSGIASPTDIHFDLRTFPGYQPGFLNGVVSFAIAFTSGSSTDYFLKINEIALITEDEYAAVLPEPSLIALILPLAALCSARRRPRS